MRKLKKYDLGYLVPDETKGCKSPLYGRVAVCAGVCGKKTKAYQRYKYFFSVGGIADQKLVQKCLRSTRLSGIPGLGFAKRQYFLCIPPDVIQLELPCVIKMHYADEIKRQHENTEEDQFGL